MIPAFFLMMLSRRHMSLIAVRRTECGSGLKMQENQPGMIHLASGILAEWGLTAMSREPDGPTQQNCLYHLILGVKAFCVAIHLNVTNHSEATGK